LEASANRVASVVHQVQASHTELGNKLRKVSILLQGESSLSNAYVALGPYRSEFYLMPPQNSFDLGGMNWVDNLSLHEYRHVMQYANFNVGIAKVLGVLFGQQVRDVANAAAVPNYFFEGDAVFNETNLSRQGRGRAPYFFNDYQSLMRDNRQYSFLKLRNGSYRDFVPDHYALGYLLVAYGREKYGADFWRKVTQDAARFKPLVYPWQGAIKKYSGETYKSYVSNAITHFQSQWQLQQQRQFNYITPKQPHGKMDYKYPSVTGNGGYIALKRGYNQIPILVSVDENGNEQKLAVRDIANDDYFSYKNEKVVYAAFHPDARWGNREFSDIVLLDINSRQRQVLTHGERNVSPDISAGGDKVAYVKMLDNQTSQLQVVNLNSDVLFRSEVQRGVVYTYPKFSADEKSIYVLPRNEDGMMALLRIDLATGKSIELLPYQRRIYGYPTVQHDTIFFTSTYRGSDEAWAYLEKTKQVYRLASHPTGLYHPSLQNGSMVSSNLTASGFKLVSISANHLLGEKV